MELWILITFAAAFFQTMRTAIQKNLKLNLSTNAISFARFVFGLPWAVLYITVLATIFDLTIPDTNIKFWVMCAIAGIGQIIATSLLVYLFSFKNFMVGTVYAKTEAIQVAILGLLFFGEDLSALGFVAVIVGIIGIFIISASGGKFNVIDLLKDITHKTALIGMASGAAFAVATLCLRSASLSLNGESLFMSASLTLVCVLALQSALFGLYMFIRERSDLVKMALQWKKTGLVGLTSVLGSACWFTAFTLTTAAYVKTVGQIEIIFTILISLLIFKEKIKMNEYVGMVFIIISVLLLVYKA